MHHDHASTPFRTSLLEENDGPGANPSANPTMGEIISQRFSRRGFLQGSLAVSAIAATVSPIALLLADDARAEAKSAFSFNEVEAGIDQTHHVAEGYDADVLLRWGDPLFADAPGLRPDEPDGGSPGAAVRLQQRLRRLHPARRRRRPRPARGQPRIHQRAPDVPRHRQDRRTARLDIAPSDQKRVDIEMAAHGGTIVEIRKADGKWQVVSRRQDEPPHHRDDRDGADRPGRRP